MSPLPTSLKTIKNVPVLQGGQPARPLLIPADSVLLKTIKNVPVSSLLFFHAPSFPEAKLLSARSALSSPVSAAFLYQRIALSRSLRTPSPSSYALPIAYWASGTPRLAAFLYQVAASRRFWSVPFP